MMSQHTKGLHSWDVKNTGAGTLELWLEGTSCTCTVAKLQNEVGKEGEPKKKVVVPPGQTTPIEVGWDTKERPNFVNTATLGTNDPTSPTVTFVIRGKVLPAVAVLPSQSITLSSISNEQTHRERLTVFSSDHSDFKLTKLTTSRPGLIVAEPVPLTPEEAKQLQVKAGYTVNLQIKPGMPPGGFREELVIQTDHLLQPEVRVTVEGNVMGPIAAVPEQLRMPNVASRDGVSREITLVVRDGKETHFEVVRRPEQVQVDLKPAVQGRSIMTVRIPPGTPPGIINDRIVLKTDHPKVSKVEIPVTIVISRSEAG
jgi:hypothetical protein